MERWMWGILFCILLVGSTSFFFYDTFDTSVKSLTFNTVHVNEQQERVLSLVDGSAGISVAYGTPVKLSFDASTSRCYERFYLPQFAVASERLPAGESLVFIPTERGSFVFTCGKNASLSGTIVVS